jgi:signal transduction histidine kinase
MVKKSNPDPQRMKKLSEIIVEEATRLSAILTDFLDFARPRSPQPRSLDVREVISKVRNNLEQESRARGIGWREETVNGAQPMITGDADLLYQAFFNVAINAFDAMKGGGTLTITISPDDSRVRIEFADDGPGIKEEDLPKIFTPFFTTHEMGTGLGLSVVHNIITAHGGEVSARSKYGQGAVFTVVLPSENMGNEGDRSTSGVRPLP